MAVETLIELFAVTFLGIPLFAVLWRYSDLPDIDWDHIVMGVLFFLAARGIGVWSTVVMGDPRIGSFLAGFFEAWAGVFDVIGAALVVEGALWNAWEFYQE
ncbi:MAG: hypothetical protein ABEI97_03315 [Candidatus Nanohaloarchaea archaeon]